MNHALKKFLKFSDIMIFAERFVNIIYWCRSVFIKLASSSFHAIYFVPTWEKCYRKTRVEASYEKWHGILVSILRNLVLTKKDVITNISSISLWALFYLPSFLHLTFSVLKNFDVTLPINIIEFH